MSSIAEELSVTSEAKLLYIGLQSATDCPDPDAPEHANVRPVFAALLTWVCCPATCASNLLWHCCPLTAGSQMLILLPAVGLLPKSL